jgi:LemA protein
MTKLGRGPRSGRGFGGARGSDTLARPGRVAADIGERTVKSWISGARALLVGLVLSVALAGCGINTIPTREEQAKAAWGEVQNQYQRRSDLVPNLVATVQGYAQQEKSVLVEVTQARAQATHVSVDASTVSDPAKFAQFEQAQNQLSGVLGHLLSISERYPDLKSNENFLALQSQLEGTENRIAIARRDYNDAVRQYNTELKTFPGVLWAGTLYSADKPMQSFAATSAAQSAPKVSFAPSSQ